MIPDVENNIAKSGVFVDQEEENKLLKSTLNYLNTELEKFKQPPLILCEVKKIIGDKAVIKLQNNNSFLVSILSGLKLEKGDLALAEQKSLTLVKKLEDAKRLNAENFVIIEKPDIGWGDIGGLNEEIKQIKEVIELPLKNPELFEKVGIEAPKGILLYGLPGTGKTLLAKAVAASTNSTFIEIISSELNQKFIGDGAKLVKDIFTLAREKAPSVVFIDELDALASQRLDIGTGGEREVERTFMQLLAEIDGFDNLKNVKIIGATNRIDVLDPALLRPGRFDRLIEIPLPDESSRKKIFEIHTKEMTLEEIDLNELIKKTEGFSGADIKYLCTEAGYFAIRGKRTIVKMEDFIKALSKFSKEDNHYLRMFG